MNSQERRLWDKIADLSIMLAKTVAALKKMDEVYSDTFGLQYPELIKEADELLANPLKLK